MADAITKRETENIIKFLKESVAYAEKRCAESPAVAHSYLSAAVESVIQGLEGNPKYIFIKNYQ